MMMVLSDHSWLLPLGATIGVICISVGIFHLKASSSSNTNTPKLKKKPEKYFRRNPIEEEYAGMTNDNPPEFHFPNGCPVQTTDSKNGVVTSYERQDSRYTVEFVSSLAGKEKITSVVLEANQILTPKVDSIYIYPIKSCAGMKLSESQVSPNGLTHDREWMIVDKKGRFLSQRKLPKLALLVPILNNNTELSLSARGYPTLQVVPPTFESPVQVYCWRDKITALDQGDEAADWLENFCENPGVRLVRFKSDFVRPTDPEYAPGYQTAFADGFPFLIVASDSLTELNARRRTILQKTDEELVDWGMDHFRPNIVLSGCPAYSEDYYLTLLINQIRFHNSKPCGRCSIPDINPESAEKLGKDDCPSKVLKTFRVGKTLGFLKEGKTEVYFGSNFVADLPFKNNFIRTGDDVHVLSINDKS